MTQAAGPITDEALVAAAERELAAAHAARRAAHARIAALDAEPAALSHHPNYTAYVHGGMLAERGFGSGHILPVLGFHALDWRDALARLDAPGSSDAGETDRLDRLRSACESDSIIDVGGEALVTDLGLLKRGRVDPYWLRRPKLGLGHAAKIFGLTPEHAGGHRGLYDLNEPALRRLFEDVGADQADQRFGALLVPAIAAGGEQLAAIGAAAFHRDADARYRDDCRRFAEHQRGTPSRRWRWKPALSAQGHLAITTARQKSIAIPAERTRGHAANWLADQNANLRFNGEDEA